MLDFNLIADIEIAVAFGLAIAFTLGYVSLFRWRKTAAGQAIFYLFLSWVLVTTISFLAVWIGPDFWLRPLWRALSWGFVVFTLGNLLWVLYRSFRKHEHPLAYVEPRHTNEIPIVKKESDRG